ncbi:aspartyl/glutamyl-tRNA amidotransferase subunit A [Spiroplasma helicoides]|uniref:Aspartyl/glutamyl-tRNA amidotransferase subunit A n=1 Tax=Spiroplasma helicoides TaxID=216938 RepID=A0A1B3SJG2_9MOLU|nr:amidase family protein [Spiroplasma helicoides]AOG60076.1 aspartyl/glutamyl-tRNA amidotransferase subunit A [Spiroplasma helicoides]
METKYLSISEIHNKLKNKELSVKELINDVHKNLESHLSSNFLVTLLENDFDGDELQKMFDEQNLLSAIPFVTKDNFSTKGILTTAGTKILENYYPPIDATITKKLKDKNTILLGKSSLDELGMGGTGLFGFNGEVHHPFDKDRIAGGSSSGSAYAVAAGLVPFATGSDTGDSIRKPASFNGIVGFKPTYGSISRYGVIPYAPSLDHLGYFTRSVEDVAILCDATYGYDEKDFTSIDNTNEYYKNFSKSPKQIKFGFIKQVEKYMKTDLKDSYEKLFEKIKKDGHTIEYIDFNEQLLESIPAVYMMISFSEAVSTHADLDGINFGLRAEGSDYIEIMKKSRTKYFGPNVKKRFTIGSLQLKKENQEELLNRSKKVRTLIIQEIKKLYEKIDILILPPSFSVAPLIKDVLGTDIEDRDDNQGVWIEDILILGNMSGMPSITLPFIKENNLPIGINLNAKPKADLELLQASNYLEQLLSKVINKEGKFNE